MCLWSDQYEFMADICFFLICGLGQVSFSLVHFSVTTLGLDLFAGAYHHKLLFLWCAVIENISIYGRCFFA
jgi:hypothetical protein